MANSVRRKAGKRARLVESATALFHEQGVHRTTLAELAGYMEQAATLTESFERGRTPQSRLKALVRNWSDMRDAVVSHGCPMGTLCAELDKIEGGLDREAAKVMAGIIDWSEGQFRQLGRQDARDLAVALFAGIQGAALLANTFRDPSLLTRQTRHLERWIDPLSGGDPPTQAGTAGT